LPARAIGAAARPRGRIINVTSRAGAYRWPLVSAYSVSKAADLDAPVARVQEVRSRDLSALRPERSA
jgi:short-subunit dehydrogenase